MGSGIGVGSQTARIFDRRPQIAVEPSQIVGHQRGQGALVYVVADNKVREVRASLGKRLDGQVEVKAGIRAEDEVVTAGNSRLSTGAEVEVVPAAAAKAE